MAKLSDQEKAQLLRRHDEGVPWTVLAAYAGVSVRTLTRWSARFQQGHLARSPRRDRGTRRLSPELNEIIEALALQRPAPTAAFIHRRVGDIARDRGLDAPSYTTVRSVIAGIDPGLRTLALSGDAAYRDKYELVHRRTASASNEQWQVDHTLLDLMALDNRGRSVRPWLTTVLDDYSRAVAGYRLSAGEPSADHTALALHQAISRKEEPTWVVSGLPDVLYTDHGSDFTSSRIAQVCLGLHIQLVHSRIGIPQGRGKIERLYRTLTTELLPHLPGFIPHATNGQPTSDPVLTLAQLDEILVHFIVHEYNTRPHSQTGLAPHARWLGAGFIPRTPAHPEDIDLLLLTAATTRRVQRDGIRFASTRYISTVLAGYVGEDVTIRYDPRDLGEIRVFHDDTFICRAIAPERDDHARPSSIAHDDGRDDSTGYAALREARIQRRRTLKDQLRHHRRTLADLPPDTRYRTTPPASAPETITQVIVAGQATGANPTDPSPPPQKKGLKTYANE